MVLCDKKVDTIKTQRQEQLELQLEARAYFHNALPNLTDFLDFCILSRDDLKKSMVVITESLSKHSKVYLYKIATSD